MRWVVMSLPIQKSRRRRPRGASLPAWGRSVVQCCGDLGVVDVGLVVPVEAGVDDLGQLLALDCLHGRFYRLVADAHRILRDGAGHYAFADSILLLLARVVADDDDLAL